MISLRLLKDRIDRWLCRKFGHRPGVSSSMSTVIPIKVLCDRCGQPVSLVGR